MDLQQILAALLNPNGTQQAQPMPQMAAQQVGDHGAPFMPQSRLAAPPQAPQRASVPMAPQGQPQGAPQADAGYGMGDTGGGIGGILQSIFQPHQAQKNATVSWLKSQGYDEGTATILAQDKTALRQAILNRGQRDKPIEINGRLVDPNDYHVLADFSDGGKPTSDIQDYEYAKKQGYPRSFTDWQLEQKRAGATNIEDIGNTKGETKYDQTVGEEIGKKTIGLMDAGMNAPSKIGALQLMKESLANVYQGAGGESLQNLRRMASSLGFNVEGVGDGDLAQALSNQMALQLRDTSNGAGMPGAMSDADRNFLKAMVPGLLKTPQGNAQLIDYMTKVEQRKADIAQLANDYMGKNNGRLDYKFFNQVTKWANANPIFGKSDQGGSQTLPLPPQQANPGPGEPASVTPAGQRVIQQMTNPAPVTDWKDWMKKGR